MSDSDWEMQLLDQQIRDKEREIAALQQEVDAIEEKRRRPKGLFKGMFNPLSDMDIFEGTGKRTRLDMAKMELEQLRAKQRTSYEAQHMTSLPDVIEKLQSLAHELLSALPMLESGGIVGLLSIYAGAEQFGKYNERANVLRAKARSLLPKYIAETQSWDNYSITAELRKYESYRDDLTAEIARHESIVNGTMVQSFITPLKEQKQLLQEIIYKLDGALKRGQQKSRVTQDDVQQAINDAKKQVKTRVGVRVACAEMKEQYPREFHDMIDREFRKLEDSLRDK